MCQELPSIIERLNSPGISGVDLAQRKTFKNILESIKLPSKSSALSVSTGDGFWDYFVFKNCGKVKSISATDIVDNPVKNEDNKILNKLGNWNFYKIKPESKLIFSNSTFDLVYHQDVIEHVEKPYLFLKEQFRVLKKRGYLIIGTPNLLRPVNIAKLLLGKLTFPVKIGYHQNIGDYVHQQEFCEYSLRLLLKEVGFRKVTAYYGYFGIHPLNMTFSSLPKSRLGQGMCHYLNFVAEK